MIVINLIGTLVALFIAVQAGYLFLLAIASIHAHKANHDFKRKPTTKFAIMIPAHDEENVIGATVTRLTCINYPKELYNIFIVADHCGDETAARARASGAYAFERNDGPRTGKGAALSWLFHQISQQYPFDAVVIFDADTRVDQDFLAVMDDRLKKGNCVIQGRHVISNPNQGWFPALTWAMFIVDNRYQNLGRTNLNWSAKHMGDSICFQRNVLLDTEWSQGLTDDYQLRQELLCKGIKIDYDPCAIGYGEAPLTWTQAKKQRERWLRGTHDASRRNARRMLLEGLKRRNLSLLDGAVQAYFVSYSTLTIISLLGFAITLLVNLMFGAIFNWVLVWILLSLVILLGFYPYMGLLLERAPLRAYPAILLGPLFIPWRTWLAFKVRKNKQKIAWVRTKHGTGVENS